MPSCEAVFSRHVNFGLKLYTGRHKTGASVLRKRQILEGKGSCTASVGRPDSRDAARNAERELSLCSIRSNQWENSDTSIA